MDRVTTDREVEVDPKWYKYQVYYRTASLLHFEGEQRVGSNTNNREG